MSNYRHVPLLLICSEMFKKSIFHCIFHFLDGNCLLSINKSGFRPGDSCIHQLVAFTHNIFIVFDVYLSLDVCSIFLDLCKAFDKVCHKDLIHILKNNGKDGNQLFVIVSPQNGKILTLTVP